MIELVTDSAANVENRPIEIVERKGIGHPDTLCDLIANNFSRRYSQHCQESLGVIPNHVVDKVALSGAISNVSFGSDIIEKPIRAFLIGKVTDKVGNSIIPVKRLFQEATIEILERIFGNRICNHLDFYIENNTPHAKDHPPGIYLPESKRQIKLSRKKLNSSDTVICVAHAGHSLAERVTVFLENFINSEDFKYNFPETGYDVKIMTLRKRENFDITICIPFIGKLTKSWSFYNDRLSQIHEQLIDTLLEKFPEGVFDLYLNTKDRGKYAYLTAFGTALDKGDQGVVGRGNMYCGYIPVSRGMSNEAPSGKNPIYHSGRIYNALANIISHHIYREYDLNNQIYILARNGEPLPKPAHFILCIENFEHVQENQLLQHLSEMIHESLCSLGQLTKQLIECNPLEMFRALPENCIKLDCLDSDKVWNGKVVS